MSTALAEVTFDEKLAKTYLPRRVVKQAVLVPVPDGVKTTINASWGEEQSFVGSWYAIYADGKVDYGSGRQEFDETHERAEEVENGYVKVTPVQAYCYHGPDARVVTVLASGVVETDVPISDGKWLMRWPHGEVGVIAEEKIRRLYQIG